MRGDVVRKSLLLAVSVEDSTMYIYAAIARVEGRDAGHVCYAHTKDAARVKAENGTTLSVVVRRESATRAQIAALVTAGKLP